MQMYKEGKPITMLNFKRNAFNTKAKTLKGYRLKRRSSEVENNKRKYEYKNERKTID